MVTDQPQIITQLKSLWSRSLQKNLRGFHERTGSGLGVLLGLLFDFLNFFENHAYIPELGLGIFENHVFEP